MSEISQASKINWRKLLVLYIPDIVFYCFSTGLMHDLTGFRKKFKSTMMERVVGQKITYAS